jgi:hypothetical protein
VSQESLRLSQQSITLRKAVTTFDFVTERGTCSVEPGVFLCSLLSITNTDDKYLRVTDLSLNEFNAERYDGVDIDPSVWQGDCRYLVSTYGHLAHACPGRTFALAAIKIVLVKYLSSLHFSPQFLSARVPETSVGAIGRSATPCVAAYSRKAATHRCSSFCKPTVLEPDTSKDATRNTVAVIGGAGFLGSRLVEMLVGHAHDLRSKGHPFFACIRVLDRCPYKVPQHVLHLASLTGQVITSECVDIVS